VMSIRPDSSALDLSPALRDVLRMHEPSARPATPPRRTAA
jgi:hypothetical protein